MKHADRLIKRILFLGGLPNLQDLGKLMIGENVREVIEMRPVAGNPLPARPQAGDHPLRERSRIIVSRELFVDILESEEEHIDWLQTQMRLIEQMGIENFVQLQTKPNESGAS